jgi:hypothetical protein
LLSKVLDKLQFEMGAIFRFNGQGNGIYIYIPDSITTDHTLNTDDLSSINISLTNMKDIIVAMDIEYKKHPAKRGYLETIKSTATSSELSALNIATNSSSEAIENKRTIRLDALVSAPNTTAQSNPNDDFWSYYFNIFGEQKTIVSAEVVSPSFYGIDVGDFVEFGTMPVNPFGGSWSGKKYITTNVQRQFGKLKCIFREV